MPSPIRSGGCGRYAAPPFAHASAVLSAIRKAWDGGRARIVRRGEPASRVDPDPRACRFYGRCPKGTAACTQTMPELAAIGAAHEVACHFPEAAPPQTVPENRHSPQYEVKADRA